MKLETYLLRSLFAACLLACALTLGAMLHTPTQPVQLAGQGATAHAA
ncbi:hypothetical protein [Fulvimonas soli]|jgi:hypothetical protein|uniref:Uncharacterized protein n=1 Tax=Fulvimonas soli TaxID=155197 RepID=A0A316IFT0_9GAMM|nr:hypothetical protein [Fulvimonas soli]PWK92332.1 hypothetical protein C7456_10265 [Fulvimonas soli]